MSALEVPVPVGPDAEAVLVELGVVVGARVLVAGFDVEVLVDTFVVVLEVEIEVVVEAVVSDTVDDRDVVAELFVVVAPTVEAVEEGEMLVLFTDTVGEVASVLVSVVKEVVFVMAVVVVGMIVEVPVAVGL